jgi:hypothetical protein
LRRCEQQVGGKWFLSEFSFLPARVAAEFEVQGQLISAIHTDITDRKKVSAAHQVSFDVTV